MRSKSPNALPDGTDPAAFEVEVAALVAADATVAGIDARLREREVKRQRTEVDLNLAIREVEQTKAQISAMRSVENVQRTKILTLVARKRKLATRGQDFGRRVSRVGALRRQVAKRLWSAARKVFGRKAKDLYQPAKYQAPEDVNPYPKVDSGETNL